MDPIRPDMDVARGKKAPSEPQEIPRGVSVGRGRPHALNDPDFAKAVAEAFMAGMSREQMCETFGVSDLATITRWRRDPRVKTWARKLSEDRVLRITRRTDAAIEARLQHTDKLTLKELLAIRKEFLGGSLRDQTESADEDMVTEAMKAMEENPEFIDRLQELFNTTPDKSK